jgi:hypothetical protein
VPGRDRVDELVEAQLAGRAQDGGDVAVRQAAADLERPVQGDGRSLALQYPGQRVDLGLGPGRQVGQGPVLDLAGLAVASRSRIAGGDPRFGTLTTYMTTIIPGISAPRQEDTPLAAQYM